MTQNQKIHVFLNLDVVYLVDFSSELFLKYRSWVKDWRRDIPGIYGAAGWGVLKL